MTVKTEHGDFECRDLTFKDRRALHRLEVQAIDSDGNFQQDKYYDVIEWVMNYAFIDAESTLGHLNDIQIDNVLTEIYSAYKEPQKKKK
tara:strand:- start:1064 stop:1330 length:267 start_codon:yes stop_codon:yes gene_type:complete